MTTVGVDAATGSQVAIAFERAIQSVDALIAGVESLPYIAPGFIDLQVNGFAGVDYNFPGAPLDEIERSLGVLFSTGVTRFLPTIITGPPATMEGALRNMAAARRTLRDGRAIEGFHVEGPHISPEDGPRGAHPREWVRPPDVQEFLRWQEAAEGNVRLVTVSPEWPETPRYIETLVGHGVVVSIGHTKATTAQLDDAVRAGATMSTHLGNGAHSMIRRHPNYIWDQLSDDRLAAGFIVDGIHLPPAFLKAAIRAKGIERSILVTDAVMPAGCQPGRFKIGEVEIELHPGDRVTLVGGDRLAGSALRMDRGIENMMRMAGISLPQALVTATQNPARVARIASRQRGLTPGERADLVEFNFDPATKSIEVLRTFLDGELAYSKN
ncbi:MAG: amidohydrolase family protein [Bryobacteraceae bacterium]|nr:amidohydrolase family protein [Bryobacteraceae bacterium]